MNASERSADVRLPAIEYVALFQSWTNSLDSNADVACQLNAAEGMRGGLAGHEPVQNPHVRRGLIAVNGPHKLYFHPSLWIISDL